MLEPGVDVEISRDYQQNFVEILRKFVCNQNFQNRFHWPSYSFEKEAIIDF